MIRRPFGTTGVDVPVIGQGTWKLRNARSAERALRLGVELGLTHIDTAELYTGAEEILAPLLRDHRAKLFVVSKVLPEHATRGGIQKACEQSLKRLGTDHLDAYLLHWLTEEVELGEAIGALEALVEQGKTRFIGVSNFEPHELDEARRLATRHPIACNQVLYHLGDRGIESALLPRCDEAGVAVVGYSPFGDGEFPPGRPAARRALTDIAERHGRTARQVALNFLTRHRATFAIPKAETEAHVRDNAAALDFTLDDAALAELDRAFPPPPAGEPLGTL
ncbi:MAG: aldo/keto reductase [Deltaproteobacteria bacterium]|nr:aldo/keto reductase [Deltaproteobacteria bacterium]